VKYILQPNQAIIKYNNALDAYNSNDSLDKNKLKEDLDKAWEEHMITYDAWNSLVRSVYFGNLFSKTK